MNRDQIIAWAREAGFRAGAIFMSNGDSLPFVAPASATSCIVELERFTQLVAAHAAAAEREACAQLVHQNALACDPGGLLQVYLASNAAAIRERKSP